MKNMTISKEISEGYKNKLKGQIYKLLPLREEKGQWVKFLDTLMLELYGMSEESESINFIILIAKLQSARYTNFFYFRKTILECINLVDTIEL